jgi:hypothetical protein
VDPRGENPEASRVASDLFDPSSIIASTRTLVLKGSGHAKYCKITGKLEY